MLYWAEPPTNALFDAIKSLNIKAALSILATGTCVKECPQADTTPINCYVTSKMRSNPNFTGCSFNIDLAYLEKWGIDAASYTNKFGSSGSSVSSLIKLPFRYSTQKAYGFCLPKVDP